MGSETDTAAIEIPNYRLVKRVGQGAFGEVWLAEEVLTRIYRAVKIVPAAGSSKQRVELDGVRQYQQRSHGHPHLVQVLTVGQTPEALYYVMEAADNALGSRAASPEDYEPLTLAGVLKREGQLSIDTALAHLTAMLEGVDHLHRNGLAHRDLKPQNVLFVDGRLKLADVGLASRDTSGRAGTPGYRTPEGTPDDLYALGVILYQMITAQPASRFPELPADLDRTHQPRRLKDVLRVIDRACHPEADLRFASPAQFLEAVGRMARAHQPRSGRRIWVPAAAALVIAACALLWLMRSQSEVLEWTQVEFVPAVVLGQANKFLLHYEPETWFRLDGWDLGREGDLKLSGAFCVGAPQPNAIMVMMLAVEDEIVHLMYYDIPGKSGARRDFQGEHRRVFHLQNARLERFATEPPCPVYVVLVATDDFFDFCERYAKGEYGPRERCLIGRIRRKAGR